MPGSHDNNLKEKQNTKPTHCSPLEDPREKAHSFKNGKYCKRIKNINSALPVQTIPQSNLTVDEGKFVL